MVEMVKCSIAIAAITLLICGSVNCVDDEDIVPMDVTLNCYVDHLKKINFLEMKSLESNLTGDQYELCEMVLKTARQKIYNSLYKEFKKNDNLKESASCILESLKSSNWSDLEIQEEIFELYQVFTKDERREKISHIRLLKHKLSNDAIISCMAENEFGELFERIFMEEDLDDQVHKFCSFKRVYEQNIVDRNYFPENWETKFMKINESICNSLNSQRFAEAEFELRQHLIRDIKENETETECLIKTYNAEHYFDKTLAIEILHELGINEEQKLKEKKKFIDSMTEITNNLARCTTSGF